MDARSMEFLVFQKMPSAFRLRRRKRIEVQAIAFLALCLHFVSPFFALFSELFIKFPLGAQIHVGGVRGGDPLECF